MWKDFYLLHETGREQMLGSPQKVKAGLIFTYALH